MMCYYIGILIFMTFTFYYAWSFDKLGRTCIAPYIAIGTTQIVKPYSHVATCRTVFVEQTMREEPLISLAKIEDASRSTMIGTLEPIV